MTFPVGDGRREEGPFPEPTAAASRSRRAWLYEAASPCRVDTESPIHAFYMSMRLRFPAKRPITLPRRQRIGLLCVLLVNAGNMSHIWGIFDVSLFSAYHYFIETGFNKVVININKSNTYLVFHQPKMSIISQFWDKFIPKTPLDALQWGFLVTPTGLKPVTF